VSSLRVGPLVGFANFYRPKTKSSKDPIKKQERVFVKTLSQLKSYRRFHSLLSTLVGILLGAGAASIMWFDAYYRTYPKDATAFLIGIKQWAILLISQLPIVR
jgi:hypothetical protein